MTDPVSVTQGLLPCPFCGGEAAIESQPSYSQAANTYNRYRAWCDQCGFGLDWRGYEPDAITAWNTRPTPDTRPAATGSVREAVTDREVDALRYLLNWSDTGTKVATIMKTFTRDGDRQYLTKDVLESLWRKLSAAIAAAPTPDAAAREAGEAERLREAEARTDGWNDFFNEHLTDGNDGYRSAEIIERCSTAFDLGWLGGLYPALTAARAALTTQGGAEG